MLGKIEIGARYPTKDLAAACDRVLDADGALVRLYGLVVAERHRERMASRGSLDPAEMIHVRQLLAAIGLIAQPDETPATAGNVDDAHDLLLYRSNTTPRWARQHD